MGLKSSSGNSDDGGTKLFVSTARDLHLFRISVFHVNVVVKSKNAILLCDPSV
jgi:hypothetical protein